MGSDPSFESGRAARPDEITVRQPAAGINHPTSELPELETGTGWPDTDEAEPGDAVTVRRGVATPAPGRSLDDGDVDDGGDGVRGGGGRAPAGRRGGCLFWLAGILAILVVVGLGTKLGGLWPHLSNPFASKTTDRSQPTLLLSIQDLSRFEAASGNFQEVIDVQKDKSFIPDVLFNNRTLFICVGSVDAYVDFSNIGKGDITESADHKSATVRLRSAQLEKPNIDHTKSYVFATQQGVVNRIGDIFANNPNKENEMYQLGEQKISQAAQDSGLVTRAETNTKQMVEQLLRSLGYTSITITFAAS